MTNKVYKDDYGTIEYKELPVQDGDVIVVKAGIATEAIDRLADMLGQTGRPGSIIVAVDKMTDIKKLDKVAMGNYGWYRDNRLSMTKKYLEAMIREEREKENNLVGLYQGIYFTLTGKYYEQPSA